MVKVVPTEGHANESLAESPDTSAGNEKGIAALNPRPPTKDPDPLAAHPDSPALGDSLFGVVGDYRSDGAIAPATVAGPDASRKQTSKRAADTAMADPVRKPSGSSSVDFEPEGRDLESGALVATDGGSEKAVLRARVEPTTSGTGNQIGAASFPPTRPDPRESILNKPGDPQSHTELSHHEDGSVEAEEDAEDGDSDEDEESEFGGARFARQLTGVGPRKRLEYKNTGVAADAGDTRKRVPFSLPQTMYMGHPVGSSAAEFLERQHHRLTDVNKRREEVARLLKLVVEHNPSSTGSALPDIDEVFPERRRRADSQGDWCV